jgi:hypothetical protein
MHFVEETSALLLTTYFPSFLPSFHSLVLCSVHGATIALAQAPVVVVFSVTGPAVKLRDSLTAIP